MGAASAGAEADGSSASVDEDLQRLVEAHRHHDPLAGHQKVLFPSPTAAVRPHRTWVQIAQRGASLDGRLHLLGG